MPINSLEYKNKRVIGMNKKYIVRLTKEERAELEDLIKKGKTAAYKIKHANILLQADAECSNWSDEEIAKAYHCHINTVRNTRQRFVEQGLEQALERKEQDEPSRERILDGAKEAKLIALSCSNPPDGHNGWSLRLLADKLVELEVVSNISYETVRRRLKKTS
jgi:transposase